jgi:hypothetical protein
VKKTSSQIEQSAPPSEEGWAAVLGAGTVLALLSLISLTAIAGWPWVAKFLESSAPAWIQAIGSIAAIAAALMIVQRQHTLEIQRRKTDERTEQLRRVRALRVVFFSAARTCESVARSVGGSNTYWPLEAEKLREIRSRLLSLDPMQVPLGKLVLLIEECVVKLQTCAKLTEELQKPRPKAIEDRIRQALMNTARECWLGLYEATDTESKLIHGKDIESDESTFADFKESRKQLDKIRAEFEADLGKPPSGKL